MLVDPATILRMLALPAETRFEVEPLGDIPGSPERWRVSTSDGVRSVIIRRPIDPEESANHAAVMEALAAKGFAHMPQLLGFAGDATVEVEPEGVTALQVVPPAGSAEAAVQALAALHGLLLREGLDWDLQPGELIPDEELPLHRLGFAAGERDPARAPLAEARAAVVASAFGFAHRNAAAANILLAPNRAWLTDFGQAGHGAQVYDVAAFLLTSGIEAAGRRALAAAYARARGWDAGPTVDLVDVAGILWGIGELLTLPRKLIETLGDDGATAHLKLSVSRIEKGIRQPAGDSANAAAIRAALWPR
jgi:hypothetical protein